MSIDRILPEGVSPHPMFTPVVKAGPTVYIAGQVARDADGNLVGKGDISLQAEQVFRNVEAALAAAGAGFQHLVRITIYLTDARFREPFNLVQRRVLLENLPASTMVIVAGLAQPDYLVEVDAVAYLG